MNAMDTGLLDSVSQSQPALAEAQEISCKAVAAGFEWDTVDDIWEQLFSEIEEVREAQASGNARELELELGDMLFCAVNVCRRFGVDAESALRASNAKFRRRWRYVEQAARAHRCSVEELTPQAIQKLWDEAKHAEKSQS